MEFVPNPVDRLRFNLFSDENLEKQERLAEAKRKGGKEALREELRKQNPEAARTTTCQS